MGSKLTHADWDRTMMRHRLSSSSEWLSPTLALSKGR